MKVMFDVDGVLADFVYGFTFLGKQMFPHTEVIHTGQQQEWDALGGLSKLERDAVWDHINQSVSFWRRLPVLCTDTERERVRNLIEMDNGPDVYFVTGRQGYQAKFQTELWLHTLFNIENPTVIVTPNKGETAHAIGADFSIDDKAGNAVYVKYHSPETASYLMDQPYNQFDQSALGSKVKRVMLLAEYLDDIQDALRGAKQG